MNRKYKSKNQLLNKFKSVNLSNKSIENLYFTVLFSRIIFFDSFIMLSMKNIKLKYFNNTFPLIKKCI